MTKSLFGAPPPPPVAPPPPPPTPDGTDANAQKTRAAQDAAAAQQRLAKGRASTVLTGGEGDTQEATTSKKTLLGA